MDPIARNDLPGITPLVDILRVPTNRNSRTLSDTRIDGIDSPEGVCCDFMVGQRSLGARLEGAVIASSGRIKCMDRAQDRIAIFSASAVIVVGICKDVVTIPVVLQKAKDLRSLRYAATTCLSKFCGQDISFDQSPMLDCCGEERRACRLSESAALNSGQIPSRETAQCLIMSSSFPQHMSQL